jgi:hypothetical protein
LTFVAEADQSLQLIAGGVRMGGQDDGLGVFGGLELTGDQLGVVTVDLASVRFQAYEVAEPVRHGVAVAGPPATLVGLGREPDQGVGLRCPDSVELE